MKIRCDPHTSDMESSKHVPPPPMEVQEEKGGGKAMQRRCRKKVSYVTHQDGWPPEKEREI